MQRPVSCYCIQIAYLGTDYMLIPDVNEVIMLILQHKTPTFYTSPHCVSLSLSPSLKISTSTHHPSGLLMWPVCKWLVTMWRSVFEGCASLCVCMYLVWVWVWADLSALMDTFTGRQLVSTQKVLSWVLSSQWPPSHATPHPCCCFPPQALVSSYQRGILDSGLQQQHFVLASTPLSPSLQHFDLFYIRLLPLPFPVGRGSQSRLKRASLTCQSPSSPFCTTCPTASLFCTEFSTATVGSHNFLMHLFSWRVIDFPPGSK